MTPVVVGVDLACVTLCTHESTAQGAGVQFEGCAALEPHFLEAAFPLSPFRSIGAVLNPTFGGLGSF